MFLLASSVAACRRVFSKETLRETLEPLSRLAHNRRIRGLFVIHCTQSDQVISPRLRDLLQAPETE